MVWKQQPYYTADPEVKVDSTTMNMGSARQEVRTVESFLQITLQEYMSGISDWLNPDYFNDIEHNSQAVINNFIEMATTRVMWYPGTILDPRTGTNIDPVAVGMNYGKKMIGIMKQINSGGMTNGTEGVSLWDKWVAM